MDQDNACSICLDKLNANYIKLDCSHQFHKHCIHQWRLRFSTGSDWERCIPTCPLCRQTILPHIITTSETARISSAAPNSTRSVLSTATRIINDLACYLPERPFGTIDIPILLMSWPQPKLTIVLASSCSPATIRAIQLFTTISIYLYQFILFYYFVKTTRTAEHTYVHTYEAPSPIFCRPWQAIHLRSTSHTNP